VQLIGVVGLENKAALDLVPGVSGAVELLLMDSSFRGGTGRVADLRLLKEAMALAGRTSVLIAGGLTPENVQARIRAVRPFGVDVQSGVEYPDNPGVKDPKRIAAFLHATKRALQSESTERTDTDP